MSRKRNSVDGDFNGAPELASLDESKSWSGVDALEGMEGRDRERPERATTAADVLAEAVAVRRAVLIDRLDEARALGLGSVFQAILTATDRSGGSGPVVTDTQVLRENLELIDGALGELERKSAAP
jgi:hypothetical protein